LNKTNVPPEYGGIIFKSLGIAFITELASDTCRDVGGTAISTKIELAGKVAILIISLPLFEKILSIAMNMIMSN
jgi:stage III sporulation protein AD